MSVQIEQRAALIMAVNNGYLDWIEQAGPFGDWRCRACYEPVDAREDDGVTLAAYVEELVAHREVCDA